MTALSTHDTKRGPRTSGPGWRCWPSCRAGGRRSPSSSERPPPYPNARVRLPAWQTLVGAGPLDRERLHAYAREGDPGGQRRDDLDRAGRGVRGGGARAVDAAVLTTPELRATWDELESALITGPGWSNALGAEAGAADHARRAGRLPGHRAVGRLAGRPGQPSAGRLRRPARACWPRARRPALGSTRPGAAKLLVTQQALLARRDRPELFTGYAPLAADRAGRRPPGRVRPRRRRHARDPAAGPPEAEGGWARHRDHAAAPAASTC